MSSTDDRIVRMQFDNAQFKKGAEETKKSLADLDKATGAAGKNKGLLDMSKQMDSVSVSASKMSIITTTALATIANKVTNVAINMSKALTFTPISEGFAEYESLLTKQNVIMNATGKSAQEVKGYLNELNRYSDQTIYSFGNMTDSIQKFVNAGVPLDTAVISIKGIANAAAFAGASAEEANRGMYAFSQSMQTGYIMLQDWMQIENANMGTIQFKNTLLEAAVAAGTLTRQGKGYVTASGTFVSATKGWRDGLQEQWATTEVLNDALGKYADRSTELGRKAFKSATEVRTFTAFMDTLKESLASGWSQVFTNLFGNLEQATKFWTGLSESVGNAVGNFFDFANTALSTWRAMGGFEKTMQGFKNILAPFAALLSAIGDAWREAFPNTGSGAGKALYGLSAAFEAVTRPLQLLANLIRGTTPVLTVFFQSFRIAGTIIGRVADQIGDFIKDLLGLAEVKVPSGGFIDFIKDLGRAIADAVDQIDDLLAKGASLSQAFGAVDINLPSMPSMPSLPSIGNIFGGGSDSGGAQQAQVAGLAEGVKDLASNLFELEGASKDVEKTAMFNPNVDLDTSRFSDYSGAVGQMVTDTRDAAGETETLGDKMGDAFSTMKDKVTGFIEGFDLEHLVSAFNMAVLSTFVISLAKFFHTLGKTFETFMGFGEAVNEVIGGVGGALQSFQTQAKAKLILNIAIAVGILAASLLVLSLIPMDRLQTALTGLAGVIGGMGLILWVFSNTMEKLDVEGMGFKMIALGIAMMSLAAAILLLSFAFVVMSKTDWDGIIKGMTTMGVLLAGLTAFGKFAQTSGAQLLGVSAAIMAVGASMLILAGALLLFALIDWGTMAKAGAALAVVTLAIGALALIPYKGIAAVGLAMLSASIGMLAIANALVIFGLVEWSSIGKAAVMLGLLTLSLLALMVVGNPVTITGIVALSFAMIGLATACLILNSVDWSSIAKIGVVMLILVVGLAALLAVLTLFAPAVLILALFAAALLALGIALAAFSASLAIAMALAAGGAAAFAAMATAAAVAIAVFMQTLAAEAPVMKTAFLSILQTLIDTIVEAVPMVINGIKRLWNAVKAELTSGDKKQGMAQGGRSWIEKLADGIKDKLPLIIKKASELIIAFIRGLASKAGQIAAAATQLVANVLNGIASRIGAVVEAGANVIIAFIKGIGKQAPRLADTAAKTMIQFINDMADAIENNTAALVGAFFNLGTAVIEGLIKGITDKFDDALGTVRDLAGGLKDAAKGVLDIFSPSRVFRDIGKFLVEGLTLGIQNHAASAIRAVAAMTTGTIAMADSLVSGYIQRLDQRALAARARAEGLARAANKAIKAANKTKDKRDDKSAKKLAKQARQADKEADKAAKAVKQEEAKQKRKEQWQNASSAKRAQIRADDAKRQIQASKQAEKDAQAALVEARALDKRAKAEGLTKEQRKNFREQADKLRKQAREYAKKANTLLGNAKKSQQDALKFQKLAGEEAAELFQKQFDAERKADEDAEAFEKLTAAEKAEIRRKEAEEMQKLADENLAKAKEKAYTDLNAANELAELALNQAEQARELLDQAEEYEKQGGAGQVLDLQPTEAAALAFNQYADLYDSAMAAAAGGQKVEFNQYNTSPESLSPSEIYRQTNNLVTYAADKLQPSAA